MDRKNAIVVMDKGKQPVPIVKAQDLGASVMPVMAQGQKNAIHAGEPGKLMAMPVSPVMDRDIRNATPVMDKAIQLVIIAGEEDI